MRRGRKVKIMAKVNKFSQIFKKLKDKSKKYNKQMNLF
jgi:hypothetical protein